MSANELEIAIVGMACRMPGAENVEAFWQNLQEGVESVSFFSPEELRQAGVSEEEQNRPGYVPAAAVMSDVERFDARFFGYTAREAQLLDPQHRLFLESCWVALERAGYDPERERGPIGVFGGVSGSAWLFALLANPRLLESVSPYQAMLSTDKDLLAPRVAYKLNLNGPAVVVQSACSTSLVAVHFAAQSLLAGECDLALAGGVSISVPQRVGYLHEPDGILSRDGHCRAFDAEASGTVRGSGVGVVLLKRLADALKDGDQIEAVIKGSATNNDGAHKVGFTAPGTEGQARVIRMAQATAGLGPEDITYIEAHGTGTALGDPIEIGALNQVFRAGTKRRGYCALGSVKTNIGHLDAAAGIAALIKVVLMLKHRELVPSLHFRRPNPRIDFGESPFFVATRRAPWSGQGAPLRAGVSSFGIGGTNAHVVLEEAPPRPEAATAPGPEVFLLSARTAAALEQASAALGQHLREQPQLRAADVAFTLRSGRRAFPHRRALVCRDLADAGQALAELDPRRVWSALADEGRPVAFLFSGQGAQHVDMARGLYEAEPDFRKEVDACCEVLKPALGRDLRELLYPSRGEAEEAAETLNETRFSQPALFTIEYALARLWMAWGVVPEAMIGHSIGEYVAACVSGVLGRDEALGLVAERARLMQDCPRGAMTAVALAEEAVRPRLGGGLDLCVVNGPEACVVGGPREAVEEFEAGLSEGGVAFSRLPTSHAFHSALMDPALGAFAARLATIPLEAPRIPFVSNLTGHWISASEATDLRYWVRHLRETVRFAEGLGALLEKPERVLLEVGPGQTLVALAKRRFAAGAAGLALGSLRHPRQEGPDEEFLLQAAARLWTAGVGIDWSPREGRRRPRRVLLPTYPFERERYWIEVGAPAPAGPKASPGRRPLHDWLYAPSWKRTESPIPRAEALGGAWCVFGEEGGLGHALTARLRQGGGRVVFVRPGTTLAWDSVDSCTLEPGRRSDYERLFEDLDDRGERPDRFVHLWGLGPGEVSLERSLLSVLRLGEIMGRRGNREATLTVVTSGTQDVTGEEPLSPRRAAVLGPCRVLSQEFPLVTCRTIDVRDGGGAASAGLVEQVVAEIAGAPAEPTVAYRGPYRWVQVFEPIPREAAVAERTRLRPGGAYLVTGGLGKVGLALARHLARAVKARLVLTGRHGLPDPSRWSECLAEGHPDRALAGRIRAVRELEGLGAEVLVVAADAANPEEMRAALARGRERFGRIDGVIHAAGELGSGVLRPLAATELDDCERQLRPKLEGAEVLDDVLGDTTPDFVLLTSSLSTVLGGLGFASYSAGNCALDAWARRQHQRGKAYWLSACWDAWRFEAGTGEFGGPAQTAIAPDEGGAVLSQLLALGPRAQVVISTTPLRERLEQWTQGGKGDAVERDGPGEEVARHPRPPIAAVYVAPEDPVERRLVALWGDMLGIDRVGVDDNFFELGGSSLLAVHLIGRLKKEYPVELSVAALFEASTVRTLSRLIRSRQGPDPSLARSAERGQARKGTHKRQRRTSDAAVE